MNIKTIIKDNAKLYMILCIIILLGVIGSSLAVLASNFNAINVNTSMLEINADISYDENSSGEEIVSNGNMLPISDNLVTGPNVTDSRVLKATFNVTGSSDNPEGSIYDIALHNVEVDCALRTKDLKWRLYKNDKLISNHNASLSPTFDTMNNNRLVLTETQEDLTTSTDKYTFLLWISESCTGDITQCDSSMDQSKYLGKEFSASIKVELSTKSKKTINRITGSEESCYYTEVEVPSCNTLTYNGNSQILINTESDGYTLKNTTGINAGTYNITANLNEEYKWSNGSTDSKVLTCTIDKKDVTITTLDQTTTYGNKISSGVSDVSVNGLLENNTLNKVYLTSSTVDVGTGKISTSNVEIVNNENKDVTSNYNITKNNTGVVTINCANISEEPTVNNKDYTGEEVTGVTGGKYVTITGDKSASKIGSYKIVAKPNKNYCWSDNTTTEKEYTWKIESNELNIELKDKTIEYTGNKVEIDKAIIKDATGKEVTDIEVTYKYYSGSSCSNNGLLTGAPTDTGEYSVKAYINETDSYAASESNCAKLTITKKNGSISSSVESLSLTYPTSGTFTYTVVGDGNISCSSSNESVATCSIDKTNKKVTVTPKTVGNTNVTVTLADGTNYKGASDTVSVSVSYDTYTITLNNQSATSAGTASLYGRYSNGIFLDSSYSKSMTTSSNNITVPAKTGYTFGGYYTKTNGEGTQLIGANGYITSNFTNTLYSDNVTLYAKWNLNTNTKYVVKHWQQNIDAATTQNSTNYTVKDTENLTGTTGSSITPSVKTYTGFTSPDKQTTTVLADGSRVVNYYYTRNSYTVTLTKGTGVSAVSGAGSYHYGKSVTIDATVSAGYTWKDWSGTHSTTTKKYTFTMPASNVSDTANTTSNTAKVTINKDGSAYSGLTVALYQSGSSKYTSPSYSSGVYTFSAVANGTYDIYVGGSDTGTDITVSTAGTATLTYYTLTLNKGTGIASTTGAGTHLSGTKVNINATASSGYTFSSWTKNEGTSPASTSASSTTVTIAAKTILTANAVDSTKPNKPTISRTDYNTFSYSATDTVGVTGYYVSTSSSAPTVASPSSTFALNTWTTATSTGNLTLSAGTYYVWARDAAGNRSDSASIGAYTISRSQGTGTTLTTRYDSTSSSTGTAFTSNIVVLHGTSIWASATANSGYNTVTLKHGSTSMTASGSSFTAGATESITSSATANTYTVNFYDNLNYLSEKDSIIVTLNGRSFYKVNDEGALVGYLYNQTYTGPLLVGTTPSSVEYYTSDNSNPFASRGSINYNGTTYYYSSDGYWFSGNVSDTSDLERTKYTVGGNNTNESLALAALQILQDNSTTVSQTFTYGVSQTLTSNIYTKTGYTFKGWSTSPTGEVLYTDKQSVSNLITSGTMNLYAIWEANTYSVNFYKNNNYAYEKDQIVVILNGRTFYKMNNEGALVGYLYNQTYTGPLLVGTTPESVEYYTSDNPNRFPTTGSINYNGTTYYYSSDGYWFSGDVPDTSIMNRKKYNTSSTIAEAAQKLLEDNIPDKNQTFVYGTQKLLQSNTYTKTGYTFKGWSTSPTGNVIYSDNDSIGKLMKENGNNINLYAVWGIDYYRVDHFHYYLDSNSVWQRFDSSSTTVMYGHSATASNSTPPNGYHSGNRYKAFYFDSTLIKDGQVNQDYFVVDGNVFTEVYYYPDTYTISYNGNGGSGVPGNQTKTYGVTLKLNSTVPTRIGYTFLGWSTNSSATSASYPAGGNYTANQGVTLYAVWKANTYSITYNLGGGSVSGNPTSYTTDTSTFTLNNPTRSGYTFLGWKENQEQISLNSKNSEVSISNDEITITNSKSGNTFSFSKIQLLGSDWSLVKEVSNFHSVGSTSGSYYHSQSSGNYILAIKANGSTADYGIYYDIYLEQGKTYIYEYTNTVANSNQYKLKNVRFYKSGGNNTGLPIETLSKGSYGNKSYSALWKANTYSISYNLDGGSVSDNPTSYTTDTSTFTLNNPTRSGYTFIGWKENQEQISLNYKDSEVIISNDEITITNSKSGNAFSNTKIQLLGSDWSLVKEVGSFDSVGSTSGSYYHSQSSGNYILAIKTNGSTQDYGIYYDIYLEQGKTYIYEYTNTVANSNQYKLKNVRFYKQGSNNTGLPIETISKGSYGNKSYTALWKATYTFRVGGQFWVRAGAKVYETAAAAVWHPENYVDYFSCDQYSTIYGIYNINTGEYVDSIPYPYTDRYSYVIVPSTAFYDSNGSYRTGAGWVNIADCYTYTT